MSDIRTLPNVGGSPHRALIGLASQAAPGAANKLARTRILKYQHSRSFVTPTAESLARLVPDGTAKPDTLSGWRLKTRPFFLSDPHDGFGGALFIDPVKGCGELVDDTFACETLAAFPADLVLAHWKLRDVHSELLGILTHT